jgi:outer membrane protein assembly factor BamD (BamD/ComL family)
MNFLLLIPILFFSLTVKADFTDWMRRNIPEEWHNDIRRTESLRALIVRPECPIEALNLPETPAQKLQELAEKYDQKKDFCKAAQNWLELNRQHPTAQYYKMSWLKAIQSFLNAEDTIATMNEANDFMDQMIGVAEIEDVHFWLLSAVHYKVVWTTDENSQDWTFMALGLSKGQSGKSKYLENMSYKSYLDKQASGQYKGKYSEIINKWIKEARDQSCSYFLKIGQYYAKKKGYYASLMRYQYILKYGITMASFPEAMYETVNSMINMAAQIENGDISDTDLRAWMRIDASKPLNRSKIAEETLTQAVSVYDTMVAHLPNSEWTRKAKDLLMPKL